MKTKFFEYLDFERVNNLLEGFNQSTGFVTAILDLDGNILSKSGWRQICTDFHRINPGTAANCTISDTVLANKMREGEKYHFYKCINGLVDVAVPIIINGEHIANLFSGQFFFEEPDISFFKKQAEIFGFEEDAYLKALAKVPVVSQEKVEIAMNFLLSITQMIAELTYEKHEQIELNKAKEKSEKDLIYISYHDYLTQIYNRRFFEEELQRLDVLRNLPITIVMGDLNGLKLINDSFGHSVGDELLKKAAEVIKKGCRSDDIIARIGGDEFAIILPNANESEAERIVKRIREEALEVRFDKAVFSISFGYATKHTEQEYIKDVLSEAENYMYKRKMYESQSIRNKTIDVIMNALFEKSAREMLHSKRVSVISSAIATELGFQKHEINKIRMSGLVHDIGKIGIDEKILNKPQRLAQNEWLEMKKHSDAGWRILASANEFSELANFVLSHHEWWNGSGYPKGRKGEEIPVEARIIAVADAYDAMTSQRAYGIPLSKKEAIMELLSYSGTQFDPKIVEVFINKVLVNEKQI